MAVYINSCTHMNIIQTLSNDPVMKGLIQQYGKLTLPSWDSQIGQNPFIDLLLFILQQQLSTKAAHKIWQRITNLLAHNITPANIIAVPDEHFRAAGLSKNKTCYMKNIAHAVINDDLQFDKLPTMTQSEITNTLVHIKGIGQWTIEMFLIFSMHRPDIFSIKDAGLMRAIQNLYGNGNTLTKEQILTISTTWKPFRSYACLYLWHSLGNLY